MKNNNVLYESGFNGLNTMIVCLVVDTDCEKSVNNKCYECIAYLFEELNDLKQIFDRRNADREVFLVVSTLF